MNRWSIGCVALAACSIGDLDLNGKACPCPDGWQCQEPESTCVRVVQNDARLNGDGIPIDAPRDGSAQLTTCLSTPPLTTLAYTTSTFNDFGDPAWMVDGGSWTASNNVLTETGLAGFAVAYRDVASPTNNYREVVTMQRTSGGDGQALEVALRLNDSMKHVYHCNWEPTDGAFLIMHTDAVNTGGTINTVTIDTSTIPGYTTTTPVTMEFQIVGTTLSCCLQGIPGASIVGTDSLYTSGSVGFKTYEMSGVYSNYSVYIP